MDKRSLLGMAMIAIVVMVWAYWQSSNQPETPVGLNQDSTKTELVSENKEIEEHVESNTTTTADDSSSIVRKYGQYFSNFAEGNEKIITVETELYTAKISSKGGVVKKWTLKNYKKWDQVPTQLINNEKGELFLTFRTTDNKKIDTRDLYFQFEDADKDFYRLGADDQITLTAKLEIEDGQSIVKTLKLHGNDYTIDSDVKISNMSDAITTRGVDLVWSDGLRYQEKNSVDESTDGKAILRMGGEVEEFNAGDESLSPSGIIDYAAIKIKYFGMAIIPQPWQDFDGTVDVEGSSKKVKNDGLVEKYNIAIRLPYDGGEQSQTFKVFLGPMEYDRLENYGLTDMMNFGFRYGIRQIGEYLMLPLLNMIHGFIPNYGIALIIFSIFIKLILYPLSIKQLQSTQKMQVLSPEINKVREKYKDDNTKQQQEIMQLYSKYGANPAGGCLPMLLQMPILFALWQLLRSQIDLRQTEFIWWITDLSVPDKLFYIGLPFMPVVSGLALAMGITMFIQQKLTITDPRQKSMVYMMPVMMTLMFSNLPAGLNLYYFMFNLLSIGQQVYMNKFSKKRVTLEDLKKTPKKEGWFAKKMKEAQELQEMQKSGKLPKQSGMPASKGGQKTKYMRKKKK